MSKFITDSDVKKLLKRPEITEYMVLREKLQEIEDKKETIENLTICCELWQKKYFKLKELIESIKEICNNNDELKGNFNLIDCDKYKLGKHNLVVKILQKIKEK